MHAVTGQVLRTTVRWARGYSQVPERASSAGIKLASLIGGGALTWYVGYKTGEHDGFWKGYEVSEKQKTHRHIKPMATAATDTGLQTSADIAAFLSRSGLL